jgi:hypothetical protein
MIITSLALNDIEHTMASGFSAVIYNIFLATQPKTVIANIVHTMRPFSVACETKQQA